MAAPPAGKRAAAKAKPADADAAAPQPPDVAQKAPYTCQTPACDSPAASRWGRFSFCKKCQVDRGTRAPDGTLILKNPRAPGSRERRHSRRVREEIAGVHELAALGLLDAARRVDVAFAGYESARVEAEAALAEWRAILEKLPRVELPSDAALSQANAGES